MVQSFRTRSSTARTFVRYGPKGGVVKKGSPTRRLSVAMRMGRSSCCVCYPSLQPGGTNELLNSPLLNPLWIPPIHTNVFPTGDSGHFNRGPGRILNQ